MHQLLHTHIQHKHPSIQDESYKLRNIPIPRTTAYVGNDVLTYGVMHEMIGWRRLRRFRLSDESKFRDEEIREHLRQTQSKRKNVDYDRVKLMRDLKTLAELGRETEFEARLTEAGIVRGSPQWKEAKRAYEAFRQSR
jgi:hypothetical protein